MIRGSLYPKAVEGLKKKDRLDMQPRIEESSKSTFIGKRFTEFCKRTDLHGYKYMVMQDLTMPERGFWGVALVVSVLVATYFVITAYKWYARNPIITVIESTHGAIWDVPFPSVTICDLNLISRSKALDMAKRIRLGDFQESQFMDMVRLAPLLLSSTKTTLDQKETLELLQDVLEMNNISVVKLFKELSPATFCNDLVERCMWKNTIYRCELLFHPIFTQFSLCCTFNYYAVDDNTKTSKSEIFQPRTPRRVASCGYQTALTLILNTEPDDYFSAAIASYGLLVFVDNAYNIPDLNSPLRMVNPSTEVFIALSPERTYATSGIRAFAPEERQCYFRNEVKLGKFHDYSYHNCMVYNKAQSIKDACGCLPLYFPNIESCRICNFSDLTCMENAMDNDKESDSKHSGLKCLPDCEHYDYPLEVALGVLATDVPLNGLAFFKDVDLTNRSLLNIFFNDLVTTRYRRDVYFNWQNLLASFGGLLSLMLGFTLISAFDFIIFFTFRLTYDALRLVAKPAEPDRQGWLKNNKVYVQEFHGREPWPWLQEGKARQDQSSRVKY